MPCENTTSGTTVSPATCAGQYSRTGTARSRVASTQSKSLTIGSTAAAAAANG